jgi:hypothetical protein
LNAESASLTAARLEIDRDRRALPPVSSAGFIDGQNLQVLHRLPSSDEWSTRRGPESRRGARRGLVLALTAVVIGGGVAMGLLLLQRSSDRAESGVTMMAGFAPTLEVPKSETADKPTATADGPTPAKAKDVAKPRPKSGPTTPLPLSVEDVQRAVGSRHAQLRACIDKNIEDLRGRVPDETKVKISILIRFESDGTVSKVTIRPDKLRRTTLEACLVGASLGLTTRPHADAYVEAEFPFEVHFEAKAGQKGTPGESHPEQSPDPDLPARSPDSGEAHEGS